MSQQNPVKRQVWHCAYCRIEIKDAGFWANGIIYCSKSCRELGFFKTVQANMSSPWYIVLAVIATLFTMAITSYLMPAHAHDIYGAWVNNENGGSCCNGRMEQDGQMTGDCFPTKAKFERGHWWAFVPHKQFWVEVPDIKIVHYKTNDVGAHLCYSDIWNIVYCFRPPFSGM